MLKTVIKCKVTNYNNIISRKLLHFDVIKINSIFLIVHGFDYY